MTNSIITFKYSDGVDLVKIYKGSDSHPILIEELLNNFCNLSDKDSLDKSSRLNWDYVVTNFICYLQASYSKGYSCNRVKIVNDFELSSVVNQYVIIPDKDKFSDYSVPLREALQLIENKQ